MPKPKRQVPWLEQRATGGNYYAFWYDAARRRVQRQSMGTTDAPEAGRRFSHWLVEHYRSQGMVAPAAIGSLTVRDLLDIYREEHIDKKVLEAETYTIICRHLDAHFGPLLPLQIEDAVEGYCERRRMGDIGRSCSSTGTLRTELSILLAALNYAVRKRRLATGDVPHIDLPPHAEPRDAWWTADQIRAILESAQGGSPRLTRAYRFAALGYYLGARRRAIEDLTWFQVDLDNRLVTLQPKGRERTKKRRPVVPIHRELLPIMQRAHAERVGEYVLDHKRPVYYLFVQALQRAGLTGHPHMLRHSRAVHLAQRGVDLYAIAGLLGDTLATVEKNYLHHAPAHLRLRLDPHGMADGMGRETG